MVRAAVAGGSTGRYCGSMLRPRVVARSTAALAVWWGCAACGPAPRPTPDDVDGLGHWLWVNGDAADDAAIVDATVRMHQAVSGDDLDPVDRGTLTDLTAAELGVVDLTDRDPGTAQGVFYAGPVGCSLDALADIFTAANQDELFPDVYDSYERTFATDRDAFLARAAPRVEWSTSYGATLVSSPYTTTSLGSLRRAVTDDDEALVGRSHMPEPATFEEGSGNSFALDFQIESYRARDDGQLVHFYGIWRDLKVGEFTMDDDVVIGFVFDALVQFDQKTTELCAAGS